MTACATRILILVLFATIVWPVSASASDPEITIAVREDARPFIWVTEDREEGTKHYEGFFWRICAEAVRRAGYRHKEIIFNATARKRFLDTATTEKGDEVDLLCDPTTITLARMENFFDLKGSASHLQFSPIVFVANGSFVQNLAAKRGIAVGSIPKRKDSKSFCEDIIAQAKDAEDKPLPPHDDVDHACKDVPWWNLSKLSCRVQLRPQPDQNNASTDGIQFAVWGYVEGSTISDALRQAIDRVPEDRIICRRPFASHAKAAEAFCRGNILRYFGDVEIVKAALRQRRKNNSIKCPADVSKATQGTYEPYAFVVSAKKSEFPERFKRALHGMFMDNTIDNLFKRHFPKSQKSPFLSTLFRIQSVPSGKE